MNRPIGNKLDIMGFEETGLQRAAKVLFEHPDKEFTLVGLAKQAGVAKQNMKSIIGILHRNKMIEYSRLGRVWRIRANDESLAFIRRKMVFNLHAVCESGLVDALEEAFHNPRAIIIFGSFRYGKDLASSDLDIAIETSLAREYNIISLDSDELSRLVKNKNIIDKLKKAQLLIKRKIQLHLFSKSNVDKDVFTSIANGIVLFGFLDLNGKGKN